MDNAKGPGWHWQAGDYWSTRVTGLQVIENPDEKSRTQPYGFAPPHPYRHSRQQRQGPFPPQVAARQRI